MLSWRARNIRRVVSSSLAGEALAMLDTIGEIVYTKSVLGFIFGGRIREVPVMIATDSQNLFKSIYSNLW